MMERIIKIEPAYDKSDPDPNKNYGVHGVDIRFVLKGEEGAVQFLLYTNWHLPHVEKELDSKINSQFPHLSCHPTPADIGYHSTTPLYEGHDFKSENCPYVDSEICYYDGSSSDADEVYNLMVKEGGEAMWKVLEERYNKQFKEESI